MGAKWWSDNKKIEVVTAFLITGKASLAAIATGVPDDTVRRWKQEPWWNELIEEIQTSSDIELDGKLQKRIEKALDLVNDRLENGDFFYDPRQGEFVRKPVNVRDGWKVASEMIDKRFLIRKFPKERVNQEGVQDILKNLAKEFADMARQKVKNNIGTKPEESSDDGTEQSEEGLQAGVRELSGEAGADQEPESKESGKTSL